MGLFAVGKCVKRKGWILSIYQRVGERYVTVKMRRTGIPNETIPEPQICEGELKFVVGGRRNV